MEDPDYRRLARSLWIHARGGRGVDVIAKTLGMSRDRIRALESGSAAIRSSVWWGLARKNGISLSHAVSAALAPRLAPKAPAVWTPISTRSRVIGPFLRELRGRRTLEEARAILDEGTIATLHHWERGRRDAPLALLLKAIDRLGSRLPVFCETLGFSRSLEEFGFQGRRPDFSEMFFSLPWAPTVFLAIQTAAYQKQRRHDARRLARQLRLTDAQVTAAMQVLADLGLVRLDGAIYRPRKGQFYAPPTLTPAKLERLHEFWFGRAQSLAAQPGLHKIEEHAMSRESLARVISWVVELRERIRAEVKASEPETLVHIHWQIADMLPPA